MMEAKRLEAIPEETVTPALAPAVAPATPERVTSNVPQTKPATAKHPGRVASGKRLAERNRLARAAKKQAEAQKQPTTTTTEANESANTTEQSSNNSTNTGYFTLGVSGLIVSAFGVYYQREAIMRTLGKAQKTVEPNPVAEDNPPPPPPPPPSPKPKVKCGIIKMK